MLKNQTGHPAQREAALSATSPARSAPVSLAHLLRDARLATIHLDASTGTVVDCNDAAANLYGFATAAELLGRSAFELAPEHQPDGPASKPRALELLASARDAGSAHVTWAQLRPDGEQWVADVHLLCLDRTHPDRLQAVVLDASAQVRSNASVAADRDFIHTLVDMSPAFIVAIDRTGRTIWMNPAMLTATGYSAAEVIGQDYAARFVPPEAREALGEVFDRIVRSGETTISTNPVMTRAGGHLLCEWRGVPVLRSGQFDFFLGFGVDITDRVNLEHRLRLSEQVFEYSGDAIVIIEHGTHVMRVNPAFTRMTGYLEAEVVGQAPLFLTDPQSEALTIDAIRRSVGARGHWSGEVALRRRDGTLFPTWATVSAIEGLEYGGNYVLLFSDRTEQKAQQDRIAFLARHDPLTGLANRITMAEQTERALGRARRSGRRVALLFLDLDRFKDINDSLGHHVGDELLRQVAERLRATVRSTDLVARPGGDEFIVLLESIGEPWEVARIAAKLQVATAEPLRIDGHDLRVTVSIGGAIFPDDAEDADTLAKYADTAMYAVKSDGRHGWALYERGMFATVAERLQLEAELRSAIRDGELDVYYQPQWASPDGPPIGFEALVRWPHPQQGLIPPDRFIPLAEETGQIDALGAFVLERACRQIVDWERSGLGEFSVAVNVSAKQLRRPDFATRVATIVRESGLSPHRLELELTESSLTDDPVQAAAMLSGLKETGVRLAIDDFGTGYSSLGHLRMFPFDRLKIDRTFVADFIGDRRSSAIVEALIAFSKALDMAVVAEGVETPEQLAMLARLGCCEFQGFLLGRPMPHTQVERWLSDLRAAD